MTEKELIKILKFISDAYPKKFEFPRETKAATKSLIQTWNAFLREYPYQVVITATKKLIVNYPEWPPTVGQLVQAIEELKTPETNKLTGGEAWQMVIEAIRKYGVVYGTKEAMSSLPERVKKAVECVGGLRVIGISDENDTYLMSQFIRIYNELTEKDIKQERLPKSVREDIERLAQRFTNPQLIERG